MKHSKRFLAILDVGHGNAAVLKDDAGVAVFDTGLGTSLIEFLKERKISKLDLVLISHADQDHISGLVHLLASKEFSIGKVRLNTDSAKASGLWDELVYELESQDAKGLLNWEVSLTANSGENLSQGSISIEVLAPGKALAAKGPGAKTTEGHKITTNSVSCVVRLSMDGKPFAVLPGDIDTVALDDLVRRMNNEKFEVTAPLLVFPHHGGLCGNTPLAQFASQVCDVFKPNTVLFSIGRGQHGTPRPEVVKAVKEQVANVRIACTQLSEHCCSALPKDEPTHLLPLFAYGRSENACCAGTMMITLDGPPSVLPATDGHHAYIEKSATTALCRGTPRR
jgi:competence protein ComEC